MVTNMQLALDGIRVVDFSRLVAGPLATQILGDFGADVIKVELPGQGDETRTVIPAPSVAGDSHFFLAYNRNKRSIALDLKTEAGRQVALDLIAKADVVIENFTSRVMKGFGLDFDSVKERFPQLVYCSISGYGRTGSWADVAGYDWAIAMESGAAAINSDPDGNIFPTAVPYVDTTSAMNAAMGILIALQARNRFGKGQLVEVALYDTGIANLGYKGYFSLLSGMSPSVQGRIPKYGIPSGQFRCSDGEVWFQAQGGKMYRAFFTEVIKRPDLLEDPRFATAASRTEHHRELYRLVADIFVEQPRATWSARLKRCGIPCGEARSIPEAMASPETAERRMVHHVAHPLGGDIPLISSPMKLSLTPERESLPPPLLGQHTSEILRDVLGYDEEKTNELIRNGTVTVASQAASA